MEEEYVSSSSIFALFVMEKVKLITFLGYNKEFDLQNSSFIIK